MRIVIVGHGPSLMGAGKGKEIDSFNHVVRLKACASLMANHTNDYGIRVDSLCMSTEVTGLVNAVIAGMYWLYPKNGKYREAVVFDAIANRGAPFMIPLFLCNHWNEEFRKIGGRHPNFSTGMAAIIIAAHYYEPEEIRLGGFDTLLDPNKEFTRHPDVPRTGTGVIGHDWETENKLLGLVEKSYNTQILPL